MFKGINGAFGESGLAKASVVTCTEVSLSTVFQVGSKEYLDVSQSTRKVNIKYENPISIMKGAPFIFCTNDFMGEQETLWDSLDCIPISGFHSRRVFLK